MITLSITTGALKTYSDITHSAKFNEANSFGETILSMKIIESVSLIIRIFVNCSMTLLAFLLVRFFIRAKS